MLLIKKYSRNGVLFTILQNIKRCLRRVDVASLESFLDLIHDLVCALENFVYGLIISAIFGHADGDGITLPRINFLVLISCVENLAQSLDAFFSVNIVFTGQHGNELITAYSVYR